MPQIVIANPPDQVDIEQLAVGFDTIKFFVVDTVFQCRDRFEKRAVSRCRSDEGCRKQHALQQQKNGKSAAKHAARKPPSAMQQQNQHSGKEKPGRSRGQPEKCRLIDPKTFDIGKKLDKMSP